MNEPKKSARRGLDVCATLAVIGVGIYVIVFIMATNGGASAHSDGVSAGGLLGAFGVLAAYLLVVLRAPTKVRWSVFAAMALFFIIAGSGASHITHASSMGGAIAGAATIFLPLLVMRLWTPKSQRLSTEA